MHGAVLLSHAVSIRSSTFNVLLLLSPVLEKQGLYFDSARRDWLRQIDVRLYFFDRFLTVGRQIVT